MLRLEPRPQPSRWWSLASPVLALLITGIGLLIVLGLHREQLLG